MKPIRIIAGLILLAAVSAAGAVQAAITYVDADWAAGGAANTTLADGSALTVNTDNNGVDGIWRERAFGNSSTILEANGATSGDADTEDTPRLRTRIDGLAAGQTYNVYLYHHVAASFRIAASLTDEAGPLPIYSGGESTQVTDAMLADFTNTVVNDSAYGTDSLHQVALGQAVASAGGTIDVYVDNDVSQATQDLRAPGGGVQWNYRTVYDGVGFAVIPEPATFALAALATVGLWGLRRRA